MNDKIADTQELYSSQKEEALRSEFYELYKQCPIPEHDILSNLGLFINSKNLSRILFMDYLYRMIVDVPGVVMELGVRWGQNLALFSEFRAIYEPYHRHRKVIGFDTFTGFPSLSDKDTSEHPIFRVGGLACTEGYEGYLDAVMRYHEAENPLAHIKKYDIRKGDAPIQLGMYLTEFPETIIALAYFDFDIYKPTKQCLEMVMSHVTKGSVIGFDELNDHDSPGETEALREVLPLHTVRLRRWRNVSRTSYFVVGE